jgi:hypothetical protein
MESFGKPTRFLLLLPLSRYDLRFLGWSILHLDILHIYEIVCEDGGPSKGSMVLIKVPGARPRELWMPIKKSLSSRASSSLSRR